MPNPNNNQPTKVTSMTPDAPPVQNQQPSKATPDASPPTTPDQEQKVPGVGGAQKDGQRQSADAPIAPASPR